MLSDDKCQLVVSFVCCMRERCEHVKWVLHNAALLHSIVSHFAHISINVLEILNEDKKYMTPYGEKEGEFCHSSSNIVI